MSVDVEEVRERRVRIPLEGGQELRVSRSGARVTIRRGYADGLDGAVLRHVGQVILDAEAVPELVEALEAIDAEP